MLLLVRSYDLLPFALLQCGAVEILIAIHHPFFILLPSLSYLISQTLYHTVAPLPCTSLIRDSLLLFSFACCTALCPLLVLFVTFVGCDLGVPLPSTGACRCRGGRFTPAWYRYCRYRIGMARCIAWVLRSFAFFVRPYVEQTTYIYTVPLPFLDWRCYGSTVLFSLLFTCSDSVVR
jgi:hypothetical protein